MGIQGTSVEMEGVVFKNSGTALGATDAELDLKNPTFVDNEVDIETTRSKGNVEGARFLPPTAALQPRSRNKGFSGNLPEMPWKRKRPKTDQPGT